MRTKDAMILGIVTILLSALMFCYFSGFDKTFVIWVVGITILTLAIFFFGAYKKGLFSDPNKK